MLADAVCHGSWIIFENCHIASDWMLKLESLYINHMKSKEINDDFRWWFVVNPTNTFPLIMLRDAIKIVIERPRTLRDNMIQQYSIEPLISDKFFNIAITPSLLATWYRFVFTFNAFHTVCLERTAYGSIGWSQPYTFDDSIRKWSLIQLRSFAKQYDSIPNENFLHFINDCNYGNDIIDVCDRRLLFNLLNQFCNGMATTSENYTVFESATVRVPFENASRENCIEYLNNLPMNLAPCELGLNNNIEYLQKVNGGNKVDFNILTFLF